MLNVEQIKPNYHKKMFERHFEKWKQRRTEKVKPTFWSYQDHY